MLVLFVIALLTPAALADSVEKIDGTSHHDGRVVSIADGELVLQLGGGGERLAIPVDDLRSITFRHDLQITPGDADVRVWTADGGILEGRIAKGDEGLLAIESRLFEAVQLPFDQLHAIRRLTGSASTPIPGFHAGHDEQDDTEDVLHVRSKESWVRVLGLVESVTPRHVSISWEGSTRTVQLDRVGAIVFAAGGQRAGARSGLVRARLSGDSEVFGIVEGYDGEALVLARGGESKIRIHARAIEELTFLTDRIAYLSDLQPATFREVPFFDREWGFRQDRNVLGGPLRLRRVTYDKGLGVHSSSSLEYDLDGSYRTFSAVVGLDDAAAETGSVTFRVLLDGTEVFALECSRTGSPQRVSVPLGEAKRLSLEVDYGPDDLDIGDLANWADAMLTR